MGCSFLRHVHARPGGASTSREFEGRCDSAMVATPTTHSPPPMERSSPLARSVPAPASGARLTSSARAVVRVDMAGNFRAWPRPTPGLGNRRGGSYLMPPQPRGRFCRPRQRPPKGRAERAPRCSDAYGSVGAAMATTEDPVIFGLHLVAALIQDAPEVVLDFLGAPDDLRRHEDDQVHPLAGAALVLEQPP